MTAAAAIASRAFLGVERSLTGRRWRARLSDDRAAAVLAQQLGLSEAIARVLAARGVAAADAETFLDPTLRALLPDPSHLIDMDRAVARIVAAITAGETIGVLGDYDVDGATASALLVRFFAALGRSVPVCIPDRMTEGYGPNPAALARLRDAGATLVITVDCGTMAFGPLEQATDAGLDIIVVDHHVAEPRLPRGCIVVNPNRADETSPCGQLAAVGVAFLLVVAVNRALRDAHWYGEGHAAPDLMAWLDLVALGTVCDVVPLTGVNRALVAQGLKIMARRGNPGIAALADVARIDRRLDCWHVGFAIGPRVNAGGRVGDSGLGIRVLATDDPAEAQALAVRLDGHNRERQEIERLVLDAALDQAERQAAAGTRVLLVSAEGWHPGVIGIVAGRLRERFDRPACVVALAAGIGKGSGRSVPGIGLGPAVIAARQQGLLRDGGGHQMAAGFTVEAARLGALHAFLLEHVDRQTGGVVEAPSIGIDGALDVAAATPELIAELERLGPFGAGNARPRFALVQARVVFAQPVGADHVRCVLTGPDGVARLKAIAFRAAGNPLGAALLATHGAPLHLAGQLRLDEWQGRASVQLVIEDAAAVAPP